MTIRRRFSLSFLAIMTLFAFTAAVYLWSNQKRARAVDDLRRAIQRQALLSSVQLTLNDTQKQISVLSQIASEAGAAGASPGDKTQFSNRLATAETSVMTFQRLSDNSPTIQDFAGAFRQLSASWRIFYENFGVNQSRAIEELVLRAEPLSRQVIEELLPKLQTEQNESAEAAGENFRSASRLSDEVTLTVLILSALAAIIVVYFVSRDMTRGLSALQAGVEAVGSGALGHRIDLNRDDELGELARAFDGMSLRLAGAREQLTKAHEQEKRKGEDLAQALEQLGKAQDQLIVQQKMASLGTLTAGIAHEIKNPLNFVNNFAEIARSLVADLRDSVGSQKERIEPKEFEFLSDTLGDLEQNADKIREHGKRADGIVKGMLMHSRGQAGSIQETNLNGLVSEYIKLAYHGIRAQDINFNVTIEEDYDSSIPPMKVVPHDLSRVILNIANNACYSADQKAKRLGNGFRPTVVARTTNLSSTVEIRIRDNGDGIPAHIREKIFEPFFTTKPAGSGTGLGLSMSYDIVVQEHHGKLRVESEPGEYAEFIITLPGS